MSAEIAPDTIIGGRYRIRRLLGRGGMGMVYEAEHTSLRRIVALKMLVPEAATDAPAVMRFLQEARAAAAIGHPGIVEIFDLSQPGEAPFLAMEKLEGEELSRYVASHHPIPPSTVVALGAELCEAVGAAHKVGIVHRDLKPDNVFVARRGDRSQIKVLDFGIAKLMQSSDMSLTQTGQVVGTPLYMSPEQMRNANVDARSDVYAIGAILYECLAGRPPFQGESITEIVVKVTSDPVTPIRSFRTDVPHALEGLLLACLEKEASRRPADANVLASALRGLEHGVTTPHPSYGLMSPVTPAPVGAPIGYLATNPAHPVAPTDPMRPGFSPAPIAMGYGAPAYTAPPYAPPAASGGTGWGLGCMIAVGLTALAVVGLGVVGAGAAIYALSGKPSGGEDTPPWQGPRIGIDLDPPRDDPPRPRADYDVLSDKISPLISDCLNRYGQQSLSSRNRYFSWCDRDTGPTGQERSVYGVFTLSDETGDDCRTAAERSNAIEPHQPELEAAATRYANAVTALAPTLGRANRYYDRESWRDDGMAQGRELHTALVPQFDEIVAADVALRALVRTQEARVHDLRIAAYANDPAHRTEYVHERFLQQALIVADFMEDLFVEDWRIRCPDRNGFYAAVAELEVRGEEIRSHTPTRELFDWDGYQDDADELVTKALQAMRAVRDELRFDEWDIRRIGTPGGSSVDNSPDAYLSAYNSFVTFHGNLR